MLGKNTRILLLLTIYFHYYYDNWSWKYHVGLDNLWQEFWNHISHLYQTKHRSCNVCKCVCMCQHQHINRRSDAIWIALSHKIHWRHICATECASVCMCVCRFGDYFQTKRVRRCINRKNTYEYMNIVQRTFNVKSLYRHTWDIFAFTQLHAIMIYAIIIIIRLFARWVHE